MKRRHLVALTGFAALCAVAPRAQAQTQSGFVLEGKFTLQFPDGPQPHQAGDLYAIEPGVLHGATFQSRTILCDVYAPRHEEYEARYRAQVCAG